MALGHPVAISLNLKSGREVGTNMTDSVELGNRSP